MARKSRKNVQATPAVVVGPVQYKVALYARISVENEQKREADTIGNQIALLKDFVSQHQDLVVFDLYCDDDISGVSFVRPEFARMMNDIRAGKATCVIVKDLSRLGRNILSRSFREWVCALSPLPIALTHCGMMPTFQSN